MIKMLLKSFAGKLGYVITRYDPARDAVEVRRSLFNTQNISVVLDIAVYRCMWWEGLETRPWVVAKT